MPQMAAASLPNADARQLHEDSGNDQEKKKSTKEKKGAKEKKNTKEKKTYLTFDVCGGLTNQRIALVQGLLIGQLTRRSVVLPLLNPNGVQHPALKYAENRDHLLPMEAFFDPNQTAAGLERLGIRLATNEELAKAADGAEQQSDRQKMAVRGRKPNWFAPFRSRRRTVWHINCTFGAIDMRGDLELQRQYWDIDSALVLAPELADAAGQVIARLRQRSIERGTGGAFNALHVRVEPDWVLHCSKWENLPRRAGDDPRDNCMTNTDQLDNVLAIEGVSSQLPLFVAGELSSDKLAKTRGLSSLVVQREKKSGRASGPGRAGSNRLQTRGYDLLSKDSLVPRLLERYSFARARDILAAIDFAVCSAAQTFVGNSVSTFAAYQLLLRERRKLRREEIGTGGSENRAAEASSWPAYEGFHYNGGAIPLRNVLFAAPMQHVGEARSGTPPRRSLKWVFTVTGSQKSYDEMTRVAVLSALANTTLIPVCIFTGARGSLSRWLEARGVRMIYHKPQWRHKLVAALDRARTLQHHTRSSQLYGDNEKMVATFLRIDIPTLGFMDPYVLYADVDVLFADDVQVSDFGEKPPKFFTMGAESTGTLISLHNARIGRSVQLGNAGVMLMNVDGLQRTHEGFVKWLFSQRNLANGMHFGIYGPGDQGAYNEYYQGRFSVRRWPLFNWKPYWGYLREAKIIHFHGPKPADYVTFIRRQTSSQLFRGLLRQCKAQAPPEGVAKQALAGRGCHIYLQLFMQWKARAAALDGQRKN